jgi:hypothetical protein
MLPRRGAVHRQASEKVGASAESNYKLCSNIRPITLLLLRIRRD